MSGMPSRLRSGPEMTRSVRPFRLMSMPIVALGRHPLLVAPHWVPKVRGSWKPWAPGMQPPGRPAVGVLPGAGKPTPSWAGICPLNGLFGMGMAGGPSEPGIPVLPKTFDMRFGMAPNRFGVPNMFMPSGSTVWCTSGCACCGCSCCGGCCNCCCCGCCGCCGCGCGGGPTAPSPSPLLEAVPLSVPGHSEYMWPKSWTGGCCLTGDGGLGRLGL
mmetsp:Transcript_86162/g.238838  ORF Transcript_86162/g.238838 Transcript_86162/m.238838 type:complete len:215 (-) Transcript_86162:1804-2448(-)